MPDHPHAAVAKRLKRASCHLDSIIDMIEKGRPCAEIAQQLSAVEGAIENAKKALIRDHLGHSAKAADVRGQALLRDFSLITKFL